MTWEATSILGARKACKPSRSTNLPQWQVCATQLLAPRQNQLISEVADHQVSGLGSYRERRSATETRICFDER